jgi:hypothetical protein
MIMFTKASPIWKKVFPNRKKMNYMVDEVFISQCVSIRIDWTSFALYSESSYLKSYQNNRSCGIFISQLDMS